MTNQLWPSWSKHSTGPILGKVQCWANGPMSNSHLSLIRGLLNALIIPCPVFQLLLCLLAFVVPSLQAALISLFPLLSLEMRYIFFLVVYIVPRFLSPVIYGFRDEQFRKYWLRYLCCGLSIRRVGPVLQKDNLEPNWNGRKGRGPSHTDEN